MAGMEWMLELVLVVLLAATLFHARAAGTRARRAEARPRGAEELVAGFNASTRQAEAGIERLRAAADGAGRQIARQVEAATALKDDLTFLIERGERLADRLDALVRAARPRAESRAPTRARCRVGAPDAERASRAARAQPGRARPAEGAEDGTMMLRISPPRACCR